MSALAVPSPTPPAPALPSPAAPALAVPSPAAPALAVPSPAEAKSSAGDQEVTLTAEAMQSARENYAYQHELDISAVTDEMIYQTGEPAKWATSHLDMSARGPPAQAMNRAMKFRPDVKQGYSALLDTFKLEFRKAWTSSKSFDFVETRRTTENSFRKRRDEVGMFKTKLQIQAILGGDHPEAREQTQNYVMWTCACARTSTRVLAPHYPLYPIAANQSGP